MKARPSALNYFRPAALMSRVTETAGGLVLHLGAPGRRVRRHLPVALWFRQCFQRSIQALRPAETLPCGARGPGPRGLDRRPPPAPRAAVCQAARRLVGPGVNVLSVFLISMGED